MWRVGQFCYSRTSKCFVVEGGSYDYPASNAYPPFWKDLDQVKPGDKELGELKIFQNTLTSALALYAKILYPPKAWKVDGADRGIKLKIGDRNAGKASLFVAVDCNYPYEKDLADELKRGIEVKIVCAKMTTQGKQSSTVRA